MSDFGNKRVKAQILEVVSEELEFMPEDAIGDSPIEKLFFFAMSATVRFGLCPCRYLTVVPKHEDLLPYLERSSRSDLVIAPQVEIAGWRVDFLISYWDYGLPEGYQGWRALIVECDGHAFHERTPQQAARDRSRDREAQAQGYGILRFTGSELVRDPMGCVLQVLNWCLKDR